MRQEMGCSGVMSSQVMMKHPVTLTYVTATDDPCHQFHQHHRKDSYTTYNVSEGVLFHTL